MHVDVHQWETWTTATLPCDECAHATCSSTLGSRHGTVGNKSAWQMTYPNAAGPNSIKQLAAPWCVACTSSSSSNGASALHTLGVKVVRTPADTGLLMCCPMSVLCCCHLQMDPKFLRNQVRTCSSNIRSLSLAAVISCAEARDASIPAGTQQHLEAAAGFLAASSQRSSRHVTCCCVLEGSAGLGLPAIGCVSWDC